MESLTEHILLLDRDGNLTTRLYLRQKHDSPFGVVRSIASEAGNRVNFWSNSSLLYPPLSSPLSSSQLLTSAGLDGMLFQPSASDPDESIDGTLMVHSGYWKGAKIQFALTLPYSIFGLSLRVITSNTFHPLVSPEDGSIASLHTTKSPSTTSNLVPLAHALHRIFTAPLAQVVGSADQVLNQEAATLFQDDKEAFAKRIKATLKLVDSEAPHSPFSVVAVDSWTPEHEDTLTKLKAEIAATGGSRD